VSKIRSAEEGSMSRRHIRASIFLVSLVFSLTCTAQTPPPARVVDLTATDGITLKATYFAAGKPGPGVLLLHQCNRQRKVWDNLAEGLAASGLNVLTVDFRGFGESGGTPLEKLSPEEVAKVFAETFPADVDTAFRYLVSQPGVTRNAIGAGGASCGVNQAVQLARRHSEVKSLVLLSETTDREGREFLRHAQGLPLFMAVADDDDDPGVVELMQWLFSLSSNPTKEFQHYPVGGHGVEMFTAHRELPGMIVDWFGITLRTGRSTAATNASAPGSREPHFLELIDRPDGASKAAHMFAESRQREPNAVLFSEEVMNRLGYDHLQSGDTKGGVELLKLNVTAYPNSANAYDSLGDAYLTDGQKDLARKCAKQALEHLAADRTVTEARRNGIKANAEQKLKQLGEAHP
jgi:dienelactone hydrolase